MLKELWKKFTKQEPPKKERKKREKKPAFVQPDLYILQRDLHEAIKDHASALDNHHERITELERGLEALRAEVRALHV